MTTLTRIQAPFAAPPDAVRPIGADGSTDLRYLDARLKLVVASLPVTILANPIMTAFAGAALAAVPATLGAVAPRNIIAAVVIQLICSVVALVGFRLNRTASRERYTVQRELVEMQTLFALGWGIVCWLFWVDGNAVNNVVIASLMSSVVWSGMFARSAHRPVFLACTLTLISLCTLRYATASGTVAHLLACFSPVWLAYILLMGASARRRLDEFLEAHFANEDLTAALRIAHADALRKRYEAESANTSKTTFLANMSHELRTPLNAILGFSEIIAERTLGPAADRYSEYARDIHNSGTHLLSLINDLLDVAKIEAGKMEIDPKPLDPAVVLMGVERLMAPRAIAKGQTLTFEIDRAGPWVIADARALKQVILNLVSNAVKFTPKGGRITVACRPSEQGGFLVSVEDNGPGVSEEKLARVFQPFAQVDNRFDRNGGGTGLGLALVQGLAQLHGGHAWMESKLGRGTTVFVHFPLVIEPALAAQNPAA